MGADGVGADGGDIVVGYSGGHVIGLNGGGVEEGGGEGLCVEILDGDAVEFEVGG